MNLIFDNNPGIQLDRVAEALKPSSLFVLVDSNTSQHVLPRLLAMSSVLPQARIIEIDAGDINKNVESLAHVWKQLSDLGATRSSLLINVGGGMVTDLGAFVASTFKRGMRFVNVPTTLLAAVDASVGGKTGINFNGLKNEVGVFNDADAVLISTIFFDTLPAEELKSGYAEMLKHSMLSSTADLDKLMSSDPLELTADKMLEQVEKSVEVKKRIVTEDPTERGLRRALNLGHTAGHAFESLALRRGKPIAHGYAVAYGLVVTLILSHLKLGMPTRYLYEFAKYVKDNYGSPSITCDDYPELLELMAHDKKNSVAGKICFTLLHEIGDVECGVNVSADDIKAALDIYRDLMGE